MKQPMNPLNIANLMAGAAKTKSAKPMDDEDMESGTPIKNAPPKGKGKQVAAMKEQEKAKGKIDPKVSAGLNKKIKSGGME